MFLLPDLSTPADAAKVAEKILAALREPFLIDDQTLVVTGSLGIALFPSDGTDAETLVKNADISMYRAKDAGRDGYQLYSVELHARAQQRMHLESQMRAALLRRNFRLHYQPIVRAATGEVIGAEALLRWTHAERGVVPPSEFIPVAEETGLIVPLGEWVLNKACAKAASWDAAGLPPLRIAVNLSARQLSQPGFASKVAACLAANRLAPDRLELEITEGLLMDSAAPINESIEELRKLSVRLSIDDFGTGYSSLAYVKRFPVSTVKIDRSFVRNIETDPRNAAVARAIIALSHGLGMEVVAEGVESDEELGLLVREGCDSAQGYVFSRPVTSAEFAAFVAASVGGAARAATPPARSVSRERSKSIVTLFGD
jgi:EAL domain-containing protein (putative c-di-GMP-specific phosphodiesterase class I)